MMWTDIVGDTIRVTQRKTATKLVIPIHANFWGWGLKKPPHGFEDLPPRLMFKIFKGI